MALKEFFIDRYLFYPDDPLTRLKLDDPVYKQERVTMRQYLLNLYRIEDGHVID